MATPPEPLSEEWFTRQRRMAALNKRAMTHHPAGDHASAMGLREIFELNEVYKDLALLSHLAPIEVALRLDMAIINVRQAVDLAVVAHPDMALRSPMPSHVPNRVQQLDDEQIQLLVRANDYLRATSKTAPIAVSRFLYRAWLWIDKTITTAQRQRSRFYAEPGRK